jgi:hypothetical protein
MVRAGRSSCISRRSPSSTSCQSPPSWGGCLSSQRGTTAPFLQRGDAARGTSFRWENAMRTGGQALAAGSFTSARGPCAGLMTTPRSQRHDGSRPSSLQSLQSLQSLHLAHLMHTFCTLYGVHMQTLCRLCAHFRCPSQ